MTNNIDYALAVAIIERIVNDHCEKLKGEAELLDSFEARKNAISQVNAIKDAFNKIRNG